jgi:energy-coupling factor transporter ATP-binding protein EcfA2
MRAQLNEEASLADTIAPGSDWVEINGQRKHVMSYLGDFLFAPERARSPVKSLSGGERNRLLLARLFAKPANCLVLDEPTNDLDIDTLELLEELLRNTEGTVFLVSHDRTFLDNVVTEVIVSEGQGMWREFVGGYSDWERVRRYGCGTGQGGREGHARARSGRGARRQGQEAQLQGTARARRSAGPDRQARGRAAGDFGAAARRRPVQAQAGRHQGAQRPPRRDRRAAADAHGAVGRDRGPREGVGGGRCAAASSACNAW